MKLAFLNYSRNPHYPNWGGAWEPVLRRTNKKRRRAFQLHRLALAVEKLHRAFRPCQRLRFFPCTR